MNLIETDFRKQYFRFYELYDLYLKSDGRRSLSFDDNGYVDDVETFITGCLSNLPMTMMLDGSSVEWKVLSCAKKTKTMIDFREDRIKCQGLLYSELPGYIRDRFNNITIDAYVVNPGATDYKALVRFLSI